jgi:5,10-methylene-tetrahydrofolate dehydrogenase/methenyl tetrahydrofolate cyclohydrolase
MQKPWLSDPQVTPITRRDAVWEQVRREVWAELSESAENPRQVQEEWKVLPGPAPFLATDDGLRSYQVVVLGRGNIVGKPMVAILCQKARHANATVTLCHSQTRNISDHCRRADILIAAMGVAAFVKAEMVKPGAVVIDVGVNRITDPDAKGGSRLVGDVDFNRVQPIAGKITPNPGGVGPMTIAMLMHNTLQASRRRRERTAS